MADSWTCRHRRGRSLHRPHASVPMATTGLWRPATLLPTASTRTGTSSAARKPPRTEPPRLGDPRFRCQLLGHEHPGGAGGLAGNAAELAPTVPLVQPRRLDAAGTEH